MRADMIRHQVVIQYFHCGIFGSGFCGGPPWIMMTSQLSLWCLTCQHAFLFPEEPVSSVWHAGRPDGRAGWRCRKKFLWTTDFGFSILSLGVLSSVVFFLHGCFTAKPTKTLGLSAEQISLGRSLGGFWLSPSYRKFFGFLFFSTGHHDFPVHSCHRNAGQVAPQLFEFMLALASLFACGKFCIDHRSGLDSQVGVAQFSHRRIALPRCQLFGVWAAEIFFCRHPPTISGAFWDFLKSRSPDFFSSS